MNDRDLSCRTFGLYVEADNSKRWAPHCFCKPYNFRKLTNGACVHLGDPQCIAEYQPSEGDTGQHFCSYNVRLNIYAFTERCSAIGQIFAMNAPCQATVNGGSYCPPPGPTCICPNNELQKNYEGGYSTIETVNGEDTYVWNSVPMMRCVQENFYSFTTSAPW